MAAEAMRNRELTTAGPARARPVGRVDCRQHAASGGRIGGGDRGDGRGDGRARRGRAGRAGGRASPRARQDRPRRGGQRRPPGPRPRRRRGRGLPRDRAQRARPGPLARRPAGERRRGRPRARSSSSTSAASSRSSSPGASASSTSTRSCCRTTRRYEELERRGARAIILSGGPNSVYDPGAPRPDPAIWSRPHPRPGHLLRRPADGPRARRRRHPVRPPRVRPGQRDASPRTTALFAGIDREQPVWMSHGDSITRLPEGFHATAQTDSTPYAGLVDAGAQPVRHPVPPRGRPHAARPGRPAQLRRRHRRDRADLDGRPTSSTRRSPTSASGSTPTPARPARTAWSSARCRAASTRPSRRRSSIARSATG